MNSENKCSIFALIKLKKKKKHLTQFFTKHRIMNYFVYLNKSEKNVTCLNQSN